MLSILERLLALERRVAELELENIELKAINTELKAENDKLKERLGLNSKNSSIPTSKELYKLKKHKAKSTKRQGAQPGHKASSKPKPVADQIVEVPLASNLCECGGVIAISNNCHVHQKIDLPEIKPIVTEYHMQRGRCRTCGKRKSSALPAGVGADLYGNRVKTVIGALTGFYKNSKREVESILKDVFNLKISLGSVSNNEFRISEKCKDNYETIALNLSYADLLHIDETSHYNKGKMGWCWLFSSAKETMIKLAESRGKKVLTNSIFGPEDSIIVSDRYAAYNYFAEENRQICWSHLARDFERFSNSSNNEIKEVGKHLKQLAYEMFAIKKALLEERIDEHIFCKRARKLRKRTWRYLKNIAHLANASQASRVAKNLLKSETMMWKFLDNPKLIPMSNNHAERQIRHYVVYRKNSYFTQSERGNRFLERVISLYLTCKQQNLNPVTYLNNLLLPAT